MRPQPNGYPNGANGNHLRRYDLDSSRDTSADERSRSRPGYGQYARPQAEQVHGVSRLDRGNAQRRSRDYDWSQVVGAEADPVRDMAHRERKSKVSRAQLFHPTRDETRTYDSTCRYPPLH